MKNRAERGWFWVSLAVTLSVLTLLVGMAVILSSAGAIWVKVLKIPNFCTLVLSAVLFFGIYGVVLLVGKEQLTVEIVGQCLKRVRRDK